MSDMVRKQIYIYRRQELLLKRLARQRGVSEAEIIRQAINREAEQNVPVIQSRDRSAWEATLKLIEERKKLGIVGEPLQWNRQEIYEERENRWPHNHSSERDQS
jgi:tRNA A-37 threonylcarbamoyl transferase component Bud32